MCIIIKNMLFLGTKILHLRERIRYISYENALFSKDMANYAIFILVPNIYNPHVNIKAVMCMKRYTNH
jgi:hypothetical protein